MNLAVAAVFSMLPALICPAQLAGEGSAPGSAPTLAGKTYYTGFNELAFMEETFVYSGYNADHSDTFSKEYAYELEYDHGVPFIRFRGDDGTEVRWLALFSDELLYAYKADSARPFFVGTYRRQAIEAMGYYSFTVSSFLTEGESAYSAENLGWTALDRPWVEGVPGQGIGETIEVMDKYVAHLLVISNGYVSYAKPYLYVYNSRLKKIRIDDLTNGRVYHFTLADTPCPQHIRLPEHSENVRITIEEVYAGTKWEDTCVNFNLRF